MGKRKSVVEIIADALAPKSPPVSKTKGYFAQAKRDQRERDRSAGVCIIRRAGCDGVARPGKSTCQSCSDIEYAKVKAKRDKSSGAVTPPG